MKDIIEISDRLVLRHGQKELVSGPADEISITIKGYFSMVARERGKLVPGSRREGHNIFTVTGKEFVTRGMSYLTYGTSAHGSGGLNPDAPARDDRVRYFGFGIGIQPEVASVTSLVSPIAFDGSNHFLAQVALPDFPSEPLKTVVRYSRAYSETELSVVSSVLLTEAGLFTDGSPLATPAYAPFTRDTSLANAASQAPIAYKSIEPFKKTQNFSLQVDWEIRL